MLAVLESIERKLKSLKVPSSKCDKIISSSPSNLKVIRGSIPLEVIAVLTSIKETVLNEKITLLVCDCSSIYNNDKELFDLVYTTLSDLPSKCKVAVIFACYIIAEMPAYKFPKPASVYWSVSRSPGFTESSKYHLTVKRPATEHSNSSSKQTELFL